MSEDLRWLIGVLVTVGVAMGVGVRSIYAKISAGDKSLHERIEKVEGNFVHKDHLDTHLNGIQRELNLMREDSRERHKELKSEQAAGMDEIKALVKDITAR